MHGTTERIDMKKDVLITISGLYQSEEDPDRIELTTRGEYFIQADEFRLKYKESELTGFEGSETRMRIKGSREVTITRSGEGGSMVLVLENGKRHQCLYQTPYGVLDLGVYTSVLESSLGEYGGDLHFRYTMDINSATTTENEIRISVKECQ